MKIKLPVFVISVLFCNAMLVFGAGVTPTPQAGSGMQKSVLAITPVSKSISLPTDGSWVNLGGISMRYAPTFTPTPVENTPPGDPRADINNERVRFYWKLNIPEDFYKKKMGNDIIEHKILGYFLILDRKSGLDSNGVIDENGIESHVYFTDKNSFDDAEFMDLEPGHDYFAQVVDVGLYKIKKIMNGKEFLSSLNVSNQTTIKVPEGFNRRKDIPKQDMHVTLAELYANKDKYDGKIIEIEGYYTKGGSKKITDMSTRNDSQIGDGTYSILGAPYIGGVVIKKQNGWFSTNNFNYVDFIGYFHSEMQKDMQYDPKTKGYKLKQMVKKYYISNITIVSVSKRP